MAQNRREELHEILCDILGSKNVYFQPPSTILMKYPCIVYKLSYVNTEYADDIPYRKKKRYDITIIDRDPDSEIPDKVSDLPFCAFDRNFTSDGLHHNVYRLYF